MLRVTPIYGSRFSPEAEQPSCSLIEYGGCRILWNVGWSPYQNQRNHPLVAGNANGIPDHDCLIVTDSTINAVGGLPLYYRQQMRRRRRRTGADDDTTGKKNSSTGTAGDKGGEVDEDDDASKKKDRSDDEKATATSQSQPKMYATYPIVQMGQMTLYDMHASISLDGGKPPYKLEDVDDAFESLISIKYSQSVEVAPGVTVTAHGAGGTVGGCYYVLRRIKDDTNVVLTTSRYHVSKELHLSPATLTKYASSPDVLVTSPGGVAFRHLRGLSHPKEDGQQRQQNKKKRRQPPPLAPVLVTQQERTLVETVLSVLRRDGNVLMPVDASGRVLELILLLHKTWQRQRLFNAYHLVWLAPLVDNTVEFARSQLEWMHPDLGNQFDAAPHANGHPFALAGVKRISTAADLQALLLDEQDNSGNSNPVCVGTVLGGWTGPRRVAQVGRQSRQRRRLHRLLPVLPTTEHVRRHRQRRWRYCDGRNE